MPSAYIFKKSAYIDKRKTLLIFEKTNPLNFFWSYGPLKIWHFKLVSKISGKLFELGA